MSRPRRPAREPLAQINVTPLVDVMLVLLIVFLVTTTLDRESVAVNLPRASGTPAPETNTVTVTLAPDEGLFVNGVSVTRDGLTAALSSWTGPSGRPTVILRADQSVPYGTFVEVAALVRAAGVERLSLLTVPVPK